MKRRAKIFLWVIGLLVALLLVGAAVLKLIFTRERILALVLPKVEQAVGRKVTVGDASLSIWGGLGLELSQVTVANRKAFSSPYLATLDGLDVRVRFWPLLRKQLDVTKLILNLPQIFLEKNKKGQTNYAGLFQSRTPEAAAKKTDSLLAVAFDRLEIKEGRVIWRDDSTQTLAALTDLSARLALARVGASGGRLSGQLAAGVQYEKGLKKFSSGRAPITLEPEVIFDLAREQVTLNSVKLTWGKVALAGSGNLSGWQRPAFDLKFLSSRINVGDLWQTLVTSFPEKLAQAQAAGFLQLDLEVIGRKGEATGPHLSGNLLLENVELKTAETPAPLRIRSGLVDFSPDELRISTQSASFGDSPLKVLATVTDFKDPRLSADLDFNLDLRFLSGLSQAKDKTKFWGTLSGRLLANGKMKQPELLNLSGSVQARDVGYQTKAMAMPVEGLNGTAEIDNQMARIQELSFKSGKSSFTLTGTLVRFVPLLFSKAPGQPKPLFTFRLDAPFFDYDEMYPTRRNAAGKVIISTDTVPLPDIEARGKAAVKRGVYSQVEFTDFTADVHYLNRLLTLDNARMTVYGGGAAGKATVDLHDQLHPQFAIAAKADSIEANGFLTRFSFFRDRLFGRMAFNGTFSSRGLLNDEIVRHLSANGKAQMTGARLVRWPLVTQLGAFLNLNLQEEQKIRDLASRFAVENGKVAFDAVTFATGDGDFALAGSVGLDGSLDYRLTTILSPENSQKFRLSSGLKQLFTTDDGRVVLDLNIGGTATDPAFALDFSRAEKKAQEQIQQKLQEKKEEVGKSLREKGQDLLQGLFKKKKP